jgi:hypothetical protein
VEGHCIGERLHRGRHVTASGHALTEELGRSHFCSLLPNPKNLFGGASRWFVPFIKRWSF